MTEPSRPRRRSAARQSAAADDWQSAVNGLSFQEARTALELAMAELQSDGLEVEEMTGLYRRAEAYAERCRAVLRNVEQEVIEWEADSSPAHEP